MRPSYLPVAALFAGASAGLLAAVPRIGVSDPDLREVAVTSLGARGEPLLEGKTVVGTDTLRFRHENHATLECTECHANGQPTVATREQWCADCHHVSARPGECSRCHGTARVAGQTIPVLYAFRLSVGEPKSRRLVFEHSRHAELACAECHTGGDPTRVERSCGSCHEPHHRPEADCTACHAEPGQGAHPEAVHRAGCGGSNCHAFVELERVEAGGTRNACLVCHQAQRDHEPGGLCGKCHLLGSRPGAARRASP